jgi:hypothetical protein
VSWKTLFGMVAGVAALGVAGAAAAMWLIDRTYPPVAPHPKRVDRPCPVVPHRAHYHHRSRGSVYIAVPKGCE